MKNRPQIVVALAALFSAATSVQAQRIDPVLASAPPPTVEEYPGVRHGGNYMFNYYLPPAPSSTPWAPAWSPDGSSLAIAMSGSIWSVDPESGLAVQLTHGEA